MTAPAPVTREGVGHWLDRWLGAREPELRALRRQLHAHPELAFAEHQTTALLVERLTEAGLAPRRLPNGTGLLCDVGAGAGPIIALRADLDALPITDETEASYRSQVPGVSHACGHDMHATVLLGTALALAELAAEGRLGGRVRLLFQPAEEVIPGGAIDLIAAGGLEGVGSAYALHCDPRVDVGQIGIKSGPITSACDTVSVRLTGPGGHTARPHLTADLVFALADVITRVPALLSRRVDPRAGLSLVWGRVTAGATHNVIPQTGSASGTVRTLDRRVWEQAPDLVKGFIDTVLAPYRLTGAVEYRRGLPPVLNDPKAASLVTRAAQSVLVEGSVVPTDQSLGGEDFAWITEEVPGALVRLGVRRPDDDDAADLHRGSFNPDERAIGCGVRVLVGTALLAAQPTGC